MSDYLEEAAEALRKAGENVPLAVTRHRAVLLIQIGDGFARLAAIERRLPPGWLPPEAPDADPR